MSSPTPRPRVRRLATTLVAVLAPGTPGDRTACVGKGLIAPQISFDPRLPTTTWQAAHLQVGGGNFGMVGSGSAPAATGRGPLSDTVVRRLLLAGQP
ncbi:hypothetical protein [Streptomyces sp. SID12501]|uniref:Uncharacterized protein n=1 Tax=Streptomyces sp. SID12501 TaxID=2706042 RepID=A0A6B3BVZ8_9ACTN|nr:hypothetical protein [Streptomyces sp. SID12501]NEC88508.1 hypothetical protein [Streptomyces sp. SID12501]